jgi:hypothetical protein
VAGRLLFGESGRKEAHDARQDGHCPGSRVTVFLLQITEQEKGSMKRRLTILTLTTLAAVAFISVVSTAPSPALAGEPPRYRGSPFLTKLMNVTLEVRAQTLPSS